MSEALVDVISVIGPNGEPKIGNCLWVLGDGTDKVQIVHGRARVPEHVARLLGKHPHFEVPALGILRTPDDQGMAEQPSSSGEVQALREQVRDLQTQLAGHQAMDQRLRALEAQASIQGPGGDDPETAPKPSDEETARRVADAAAFLEEDDAELAAELAETEAELNAVQKAAEDAPVTLPDPLNYSEAFQPLTSEGLPRCRARKGDGGQCSNQDVGRGGCHMTAHQAQLGLIA